MIRADSVLALAVGCTDLTGEERVRERDRGVPLAGSSTLNRFELGVPGEAETHRYKKITAIPGSLDDLKPVPRRLSVAAERDLAGRRLHRRPGAWQPGGASLPRLLRLLLLPSALHCVGRPGVRGCGLRTSTRRRARRRNWRVERIRDRWPETGIVVRGDGGFCRDELMTWCEDNGVDYLFGLSRNPRLAERIARQLRKSRRRCLSTGESSRRFCDFRYRTRRSWSRTRRVVAKAEWLPGPRGLNARFVVTSLGCKRAGAQALYEDLYCARGENRIKEQQLDLFADRTSTATGEPVAPRLCDVRQPWRRFGGSAWPAPGRTGRRPERFGRSSSRSPSASPFGGFCSRFRRSGRGRICSPGFWRTCRRLRRRPRPDAARGPDSPFLKAGTPATGQVCSGTGFHGVGVARNRSSSCFVHKKSLLANCALLPRLAGRPENRARNLNPAP